MKKVLVAMSGGVDSSVTAYLLKDAGYDVVGATMRLFCYGENNEVVSDRNCCSLDSIEDARKICHSLGIPHYVLDFKEEFESKVINNFISEYLCGRTPNPCVVCNVEIKFKLLLNKALSLGMDFIATGHYARVVYDRVKEKYLLLLGMDRKKDQSYFLWGLRQNELMHTIFPLGEKTKEEIKDIAKNLGFPNSEKKESQEVCFVPDRNHVKFIEDRLGKSEILSDGKVMNKEGYELGTHRGIHNFTIGQRRGIGISSRNRMYVVGLIPENNVVVIGDESLLLKKEFFVSDTSWIYFDNLSEPMRVWTKIRYGHSGDWATIYPLDNGKIKVVYDFSQRAISPGQSCVFYDGEVVLGGGIIEKVTSSE